MEVPRRPVQVLVVEFPTAELGDPSKLLVFFQELPVVSASAFSFHAVSLSQCDIDFEE